MQDQLLLSIHHPILENHKVRDRELLPGLAYIDMLYQMFREYGHDYTGLELRGLTIFNPLVVERDCSVMLTIRCSEKRAGQWQIRVEGEKRHYVTAEMHAREPVVFDETLDLETLRQSTANIVGLDQAYERCRRRHLVHTGIMKAEGSVYHLDTAVVMDLRVGQPALANAGNFMFHPALMDGSGLGAIEMPDLAVQEEPRLFLPLFFESFCAGELLQERCVTRIKTSSVRRKKELLYVAMEFFNESGRKVGELRNVINKLVREEGVTRPEPVKIKSSFTPVKRSIRESDAGTVSCHEAELFLRQLLADRLKKPPEQIETRVGYYEMGLDSPGLLETVQAIEAKVGTPLPPTLLFEYTTIEELAAHLTENYASKFGQPNAAEQHIKQELPKTNTSIKSFCRGSPDVSRGQFFQKESPLVAIIGMAGRYPGARNPREFWKNLKEGKDCITEIPKSRWDWRRFEGLKSPSGKRISRWGGFIDNVDCFDAQFFRISPREAEVMDPQERLFLETCWEAIEDAGYTSKTLVLPRGPRKRRQVGVFVGVMNKDYALVGAEAAAREEIFPLSLNDAPIANRVSYFFNFHGPSMAIDTVCSSSLTALHLALESLGSEESEVALAGGVNLSLHPHKYMTCGAVDMHSSDGYCHTFGKGGDGYVSAEGVGAVLLKPLSQALRDQDHIYAVIKGSTINHGGRVSGITVPSPVAQADMILACLEKTGIHPRTITYVEAHGTGTSLGDPIEVRGLVKAYRHYTADRQFCAIGSVKSNIGHAESAAGIAGLTRAVLQLYHKTVVPSLHSGELNPHIDFKQSPFYVRQQTGEWKQPIISENGHKVTYPRRAGLSSFGASGANAHVILEEYLPRETSTQIPAVLEHRAGPVIIPLSARDKERLHVYAGELLAFLQGLSLQENPQPGLEKQETRQQEILETKIRRVLAAILHVEEDDVDIESEWNEYGVEPFHMVQAREKLREELEIEIDVNEMEQGCSIASLAADLVTHHQEALSSDDLWCRDETGEPEIRPSGSDIQLADIAYTLQVGREAMEERVIFMVSTIPELVQKLEAFIQNSDDIEHCYRGQARSNHPTAALLTTDEDSRGFIHKWIRKGRFDKIARVWVDGGTIDWGLLVGETRPVRISLPTYPFARERYWVPGVDTGAGSIRKNPDLSVRQDDTLAFKTQNAFEIMTFKEEWQEQALPDTPPVEINTVVCFLSDPGYQQATVEAMQAFNRQVKVIFISRGTGCKKHSPQQYSIDHSRRDTYEEAFQSIRADWGQVDALLYPVTLEDPGGTRDYSCIVYLLQAAAFTALKVGRLILTASFTNELDRCFLESWLGFERSLGLVLPKTRAAAILQDKTFGPQDKETAVRDWLQILRAELQTPGLESVLYQGGKRYVCRVRPTTLTTGGTPVKPGGTYLVTGGCGGLGLLLARHWAETHPLNLVLTGRSRLDREKQSKIKALEDLGSRVLYLQADICDAARLKEELNRAKERFGDIHGVVHAAGIPGRQTLFEKDLHTFQQVLEAKIQGTLVLDELLQDEPLDFTCYFSSSSAILGDFGSCDYAIGNRFQMAYAHYRDHLQARGQRRGKTIAINWPLWKEGGMGFIDARMTEMVLESSGQGFLQTRDGLALFDRLLSQDYPQYLVIVGQPGRVHRFLGLTEDRPAGTPPGISGASSGTRSENREGLSLEQQLQRDLQEHISQVLKLPRERLRTDETLADFGFDSIGLTELASRLTGYYHIEITPSVFFGHSTIEKLVGYFLTQYEEAIHEFYREGEAGEAAPAAPGAQESQKSGFAVKGDNHGVPGPPEPIAVIGMSGRFPMADTIEEFWQNLAEGKDCIREIPAHRWDWRQYSSERGRAADKINCKWGGFLTGIDQFDPMFFEIAPKEAELMDPKQRLFLEEAWHALEDAGYMGERIRGTLCGVYVGVEEGEYGFLTGESGQINSSQNATLSARIAYTLDLKGPNLALTAACSSGLAAVHQACLALRHGDCEIALAGGIHLMISPRLYVGLSRLELLSPEGKCRVFDRRANGLVPGEAAAVVVLKPLSRAIADKDHIYGYIKASGVNYDGKTNGITAPNPLSQAELIQHIYDRYHIDPAQIQYVLSHSTGAKLGDPLEIEAFTTAFDKYTDLKQFCSIGSIKPLIGHTFAASGIVNLIGMLMAMKYHIIPGLPHFESPNEHIDFKKSPFMVHQENQPWTASHYGPRMGVIGTTGISGTNAHAVIEEYLPSPAETGHSRFTPSSQVVILSARSPERLQAAARKMLDFLRQESTGAAHLADIAYTLQIGRETMKERLAMVAPSKQELSQRLEAFISLPPGDLPGNRIFTGSSEPAPGGKESQLPVQKALAERDPEPLAQLWVKGNPVPWQQWHKDRPVRIISLPTYPFKKRRCWFSPGQRDHVGEKPGMTPVPAGDENKVVEFYSFLAAGKTGEFQEEYLTFCPFPEKIPGFSMTRVFLNPGAYPVEVELVKEKQIEMRQVLFCKEDFNRIHTVLDIGCGHGTDVLQIAALYPHIQTHGFTVTQSQAHLGNQRIARRNLSSRAKIFHKDSSKDAFPGRYDLIIGIEVSFHIRDKHGLFRSIASALEEEGRVLLMDYIAHLQGPIVDPQVEISIPTQQDWIDILSTHQLVIDEIIDVSPQVANFLYDPEMEQNIKELPPVARDSFRNYVNQSLSLEKGWISYCLFKLNRDRERSVQECRRENAARVSAKTSYPAALAKMLKRGHIPYPENSKNLTAAVPHDAAHRPGTGRGERVNNQEPGAILESLQEIFIAVLGLQSEELQEAGTFKELGISSINAVELVEAINKEFHLSLPTSIVLACNNLESLAVYIENTPGAIKRFDQTFSNLRPPAGEPGDIAIIGLSCRCAGARGQHEFWGLVSQGKSSIREIKNKAWLDFFRFNSTARIPNRYGAMEDQEYFDPLFFNISPKEAESMDVSQRIILEEIYKALEDSGYPPSRLSERSVGTFIGTMGITPLDQDFSHFSMLGLDTSILSSRIAYCFDFKGPSLAVNTACSSSLAAIDIASQKLKSRDIDLGIAGGVTIYAHPGAFIAMNNAGMLSPTGECRPFDQRADGIVLGDGAGIVILKRLAEAQRDRDSIYGIIRGCGLNQDGQTSGITVPSFLAQSQLEEAVYRKNQVCVEDIQYVETHGTGTKLGDPVEIHALHHTFRKFTPRRGFCAIGSLKANIGHTTAAAGVLSVIKVLLSLKYKQIPPSVNFNKENPHIDFADSQFFVNTTLKEWTANSKGSRLAAVSSFGFSGTNAHLVIEESPGISFTSADPVNESTPGILTLSAKDEGSLRQYARDIREFLRTHRDIGLEDFLYTFQVSREAMSCRLALVANNKEKLSEQLEQFLGGQIKKTGGIYMGTVSNKESLDLGDTEEGKKFLQQLLRNQKTEKLAQLWVKGNPIDWELLYGAGVPRRLPGLPTYPFARERWRVPGIDIEASGRAIETAAASAAFLHPLLHRNTSDFQEQRFSSTFTGREFFLADHVVKGRPILPGVAYLEMIRAAVENASAGSAAARAGIRLINLVWIRPLVVENQPVQVHIALYPADNGEISFEIYGEPAADSQKPVVYCQGSALPGSGHKVKPLDLQALAAECNRSSLSADQCLAAFQAMGIDYGPAHQGIETVKVGGGQVLAKLTLPSAAAETLEQFILHPSLMDSALQASIGLVIGSGDSPSPPGSASLKPALPFALQELELFSPCTSAMWALVRFAGDSSAEDKVRKLDIHLSDETGRICVRMKGLSARVLDSADQDEALVLRPGWREQAAARESAAPAYTQHLILVCQPEKKWKLGSWEVGKKREDSKPGKGWSAPSVKIIELLSQQEGIEQRFQDYALRVFEEIQRIFKDKSIGKVLIQVLVAAQGEQQVFSGLSGLLKTAVLENPKLVGQVIEVEPGEDPQEIAAKLEENSRCPGDNRVRYQGGKRWIVDWTRAAVSRETGPIPWKDRGIYLITGGMGGLGLIFAQEIARQVKDATLILTGRSPLEVLAKEKQKRLKELQALGARVEYRPAEVTDKAAVTSLVQGICRDFGHLHGIIHAAGVVRDNFLLKKTAREFREVLAPKVAGLVNLDQASQDLGLDFFVFFSSLAGVSGNTGQADYAAANAFMDAYAGYRSDLATLKQRRGQTLSIAWPLWQEGGMQMDEETEKIMKQHTGMEPLSTPGGIRAFYRALASGAHRVWVLSGTQTQLQSSLLSRQPDTPAPTLAADPAPAGDLLQEKALHYFKHLLAPVIGLPMDRIDADAPMEKYGIDSIMVMELTNQLEKTFGSLSKTLFFEYRDLRELTGYFLEFHRDRLMGLPGIREEPGAVSAVSAAGNAALETMRLKSVPGSSRRHGFASFRSRAREENSAGALDIAIIGLSGRYPQAGNIREFWENLQDGKDCITEIPGDRWDHSLYFDPDKNKPGKIYSKWGGFLEGVDRFDPLFFNISPLEAEVMDPQERLFLECVYETLEDAGYTRETLALHRGFGLSGNVGVYVGVMYEEYQLYGAQEQVRGRPIALGGNPSSIANRVSYFCNFHGPSMAVDTMCSSSLTAIYLACQSLRRGECELAAAGGVNVSIHPNKYLMLAQGKFVSGKGRCESFGQGSDGYVPGEGVGAVLLKPLSKAVLAGDHIYGIIKAAAINHGGKTNGYTVPNPNAQASVIGRAFKQAGIHPRAVSYLEAHGTGTSLGDPIEITGLTKAFREYTKDNQFCAVGSVKSNIGHCESAAGIAGLTKVLLQLRHGQLVPSLHSEVLNPHIDFSNTPFVVQQKLAEWKPPLVEAEGGPRGYPRIAGISSFGAGGSNAHLVIQEYIPEEPEPLPLSVTTPVPAFIVLSAKNEEQLRQQVERLLFAIEKKSFTDAQLPDIAYTLQVGREAMEERLAMTVKSLRELREKLQGFLEGREGIEDLYRGRVKENRETLAGPGGGGEEALPGLWVKGLAVDWGKLYVGSPPGWPRRVSLPTYPFARQRCWAPGTGAEAVGRSTDAASPPAAVSSEDAVMLVPVWDAVPAPGGQIFPPPTGKVVIVGGTREQRSAIRQFYPNGRVLNLRPGDSVEAMIKKLEVYASVNPIDHIAWIAPSSSWKSLADDTLIQEQDRGVLPCFRLIKALLRLGYGSRVLGWSVITVQAQSFHDNDVINPVHAGLHGLVGSLAKEYPQWKIRLIDLQSSENWPMAQIFTLPPDPLGNALLHRNRRWYRQQLIPINNKKFLRGGSGGAVFSKSAPPGRRRQGVYVVIGGAGGIGEVWSEYMIRTYQAQIIWIGRRPKDAAIEAKLTRLAALGPAPHYIAADATRREPLQQAYEEIKQRYSQVNGVIHSAIVLLDKSLAQMEEEQFQAALSAKVAVSVRIAQVFPKDLDFVLFFSSLLAFTKNPGQSNYASGCTFMDAFAHRLAREWPGQVKTMNWGYWGSVGVVASSDYRERMAQAGVGSIEPPEAMEALEILLAAPMNQMALIKTTQPRLEE